MFAIYMAVFCAFTFVFRSVSRMIRNKQTKERAISRGQDWWIDPDTGYRVRVSDDVLYSVELIGHDWCEVSSNGTIIRNISAEERTDIETKSRRESDETGSRYYMIDNHTHSRHYEDGCYGEHYKCFDDDEIYVKRRFNGIDGWVNVNTGMAKELDVLSIKNKTERQIKNGLDGINYHNEMRTIYNAGIKKWKTGN